MNRGLYLFFFLLIFASCTPKAKITRVIRQETVVSDIKLLKNALDKSNLSYNWLITNGELSYNDGTNDNTVNITIRNRKDSIFWASATLLIEAVRILVNKDSATVMNKLQKNYSVIPVSDLSNLFSINNLKLSSIQNLLQARPPFELDDKSIFEIKDGNYVLQNQQAGFKEELTIDKNILRMTRYRYERNTSEYILVSYSHFTKVGNELLPNIIDMEVHTPDKIHIILNVSDYSLQETDDAPFFIPKSYIRVK